MLISCFDLNKKSRRDSTFKVCSIVQLWMKNRTRFFLLSLCLSLFQSNKSHSRERSFSRSSFDRLIFTTFFTYVHYDESDALVAHHIYSIMLSSLVVHCSYYLDEYMCMMLEACMNSPLRLR